MQRVFYNKKNIYLMSSYILMYLLKEIRKELFYEKK
jgi:hypothetical protein